MNRRSFLRWTGAAAATLLTQRPPLRGGLFGGSLWAAPAPGGPGGGGGKAPRPDIVFILADDLGHCDVGFTGGKVIRTPNLDKLAAAGAVLKQFYVQPVCSPTRSSLMTGRYPIRQGLQVGVIRPHSQYGLPLEERTLAGALKQAGYTTAVCGKWHLGDFDKAYWPNARGFDHWYGHLFGALDYNTHIRDGELDWYRNGQKCKDEGYTTHLVAREAVDVIARQPKDKPLFLYVPFNAVHSPWQVPGKYEQPYGELKGARRTYAGMVAALDEAVGQIVAAVEKAGRRGNTLFVFSSDNGGPAPGRVTDNGPLRAGKGTVYEGGTRVCAFATWDGHLKAGSSVEAPLHMVDWYPTLLTLAGAPLDQSLPLDGRDAWDAIARGGPSPHEDILLNAAPAGGALRAGDWKIVVHNRGDGAAKGKKAAKKPAPRPGVELYNLRDDIGEKTDLASAHPDKVDELRRRYDAYARAAVPPKNQE